MGKSNAKPPRRRVRAGQVNKKKIVPEPPAKRRCIARLKSDPTKQCSAYAQPGSKYCASHNGPDTTTHGLTAKYQKGLFTDYIRDAEAPLDQVKDLAGEIAVLRGVLAAMLEVTTVASDDERTAVVYSSAGAIKDLVDTIGKTADRMERIEHGLTLNLNARQVAALAHQVVRIINQEVADPMVRQKISQRIANLVVV